MIEQISHLGLLEDDAIRIDIAALEIAALDHPDAQLGGYFDSLDEMTRDLNDIAHCADSAERQAEVLAQVLVNPAVVLAATRRIAACAVRPEARLAVVPALVVTETARPVAGRGTARRPTLLVVVRVAASLRPALLVPVACPMTMISSACSRSFATSS